jgi:hypothetical protein
MKLIILVLAVFGGHVYAETIGNKICTFFSASIEPIKCFRKLSDCERNLEEMSTSELNRDISCSRP